MTKTIFISVHSLFSQQGQDIYGTGSYLQKFLTERKENFCFLKHPIYGGMPTQIEGLDRGKIFCYKERFSNSRLLLIKSFQEFLITLKSSRRKNISLFVGIDPLNALFGILLKKMGKAEKVIFYTADYTPTRYNNFFLNQIYHLIDRYAIRAVDEVWNVSSRITSLRKEQNVPDSRNFFVPNSPAFNSIKRKGMKDINRSELITVTTSSKNTDFPVIFRAMKKLSKKYPAVILTVIGLNNWQEEFSSLIKENGLQNRIVFKGSMSHEELLDNLCRAGIGLALYTNAFSWTFYSDSMKVRDFLACGLPVVMTNVSSTAQDIEQYRAGLVVKLNEENLFQTIDKLLKDDKIYISLRKNAVNLAKKYDAEKIFDSLFFHRPTNL